LNHRKDTHRYSSFKFLKNKLSFCPSTKLSSSNIDEQDIQTKLTEQEILYNHGDLSTNKEVLWSDRSLLKPGPGHSYQAPISSSVAGKKQALKVVLSLAIIWIVINEKYAELKKKVMDTIDENRQAETFLSKDGLSYEDITSGSHQPKTGELVTIELIISYNGRIIRPDELLKESRQVDRVQFIKNGTFEKDVETAFGVQGIQDIVRTLNCGGKRRIRIPANIAFRNKIIPYLIDPESLITIDITMDSSTNLGD